MHNIVSFNHQISSSSETNFSAISSAALYGRGIFTSLAVYHSSPFLWEKHWLRVRENAQKIGIDLTEFSEESVKNSLTEIIEQNSLIKGRARLTFFDQKPGKIWSFPSAVKTSLLITTGDFRETPEINLTVSPYSLNSTSPLVNVKSCNYLENLLAFEEAQRRGFNEAVRLNERDEITSGTMANIFWLKDGRIFTPGLETGCLAGTTRSFVLENFSVNEIKAGLNDLEQADGVFLTSAGIGLVKVKAFGKRVYQYPDRFFQIENFFHRFIIETHRTP